jgi:hypothetical protein
MQGVMRRLSWLLWAYRIITAETAILHQQSVSFGGYFIQLTAQPIHFSFIIGHYVHASM